MDDITVVDIKPQKVIGMKKKGKYELIAELLPKVFQHAVAKSAQIAGHPLFICHETSKEEVEKANSEGSAVVEVAVPIAEEIDGTDEITCYELPGGKMLKTIHKGPYEECEPTYDKLYAWLKENNKTITGPTREAYLNDPREVNPEEILTEIYIPID